MASNLNLTNYSRWDVDDVSTWLGQIHLSQLVPNFERLGIMGADLPRLSDQYIQGQMRIRKPAEIMALKGAISHLVDNSQPKYQVPPTAKRPPQLRKISGPQAAANTHRKTSIERPLSIPEKAQLNPITRYNTIGTEKIAMSKQPQLKDVSAPELLDDQHRHAGWIRKQGGGYKNWRRRYLILRRGCLYYFANETASQAKGSFMLTGYRAEVCNDPKIIERFKHTLKLTPMNPAVRTYYIAVGSKRELESWLQAINEEITICQDRTRVSVVQAMYDDGDDEDPDDIDPGGEHVYDDPDTPYEPMDADDRIYDEPPGEESDEDEDDPYCHIEEHLVSPTLPKGPPGVEGAPVVPERSQVSLIEGNVSKTAVKKDRKVASRPSEGANEEPNDDTYLRILGPGSEQLPEGVVAAIAAQTQEELTTVIQRGGRDITVPTSKADPEPTNIDYEDAAGVDSDDNGEEDEEDDADDPYYVLFRKPEELMPTSCIFDILERPEADRLLRAKNRNGTYLIRGGAHAGAENVLSVWQVDRCRHYKLFKDDANGYYSLTQGQSFKTIPELIQYYSLQAQLPRSDFYLGDPYHPEDH